jgi:hypothetical protein
LVRSERILLEQLDYNLLFRWFVGLNMEDSVWEVTVFTKNRERRHAADSTTPQKTAVYPRIIPRTGQFGTVSELKPSHTLHASLLEAHGKMRLVQGYSSGMLVPDCECFR